MLPVASSAHVPEGLAFQYASLLLESRSGTVGVVPAEAMVNYTITFNDDGTFAAKADCNQVSGTYTIEDNSVLTIVPGPSTSAST